MNANRYFIDGVVTVSVGMSHQIDLMPVTAILASAFDYGNNNHISAGNCISIRIGDSPLKAAEYLFKILKFEIDFQFFIGSDFDLMFLHLPEWALSPRQICPLSDVFYSISAFPVGLGRIHPVTIGIHQEYEGAGDRSIARRDVSKDDADFILLVVAEIKIDYRISIAGNFDGFSLRFAAAGKLGLQDDPTGENLNK
jgi:hypothetical protein